MNLVKVYCQVGKISSVILFLFLFSMVFNPVWAQIATPSLDSILLINMPAATGWRYKSTAGLSVINGEGKEVEDNSNETSISWSELSYLIASHVTGPFYTGAFRSLERWEKVDNNNNESEKYEINRTQVNFAFRMDESYSLGGSFFSSENILESDSIDTFYNEVKEEQTGIGAGISARFSDQVFLAFGVEYVDEKSTSQSQGSEVVNSSWLNQLYGIAFMDGNKENPRFRVELSRIDTPEVESDSSNLSTPTHFASIDTRLSVEFIVERWETLFRYERENYTESASPNTIERIYDSYGVAKISDKGWTYGIYLITGKETTSFSYSSNTSRESETASTTYYRANLAYNF